MPPLTLSGATAISIISLFEESRVINTRNRTVPIFFMYNFCLQKRRASIIKEMRLAYVV